uniref:N-acetylglucosaminyldiphosphoundecaprenol n=1 Tax=uncultured Chloroflexota bacterium TaxID=166587 RepID=H5SIC3_9CHLR|nr:N-acetylglucosaminyldiphosphoundecaprenol [uncultured Chloroflexota bacterium]BAL55909.1 N-acetylglucosaminyldiphosphoundecaprenol [uncultured Chloroflexota bacterium]
MNEREWQSLRFEAVSRFILGTRVDAISYSQAIQRVMNWAVAGESRYVCAANVHMVMEAYDDPIFREMVNAADLVTPDGMPLVWVLRRLGFSRQERVYGPTLTLLVAEEAAQRGIPIGFYGGQPEAAQGISENLSRRFPGLQVAYCYSPPFRPLMPEEDEQVVQAINASGARILFVGLGCPKQERWMATHKGRVRAVMLGVGAAFDFLAGRIPQAPPWLQQMGLEWFFRLIHEPRRLWKRYFYHNPRFVFLTFITLLRKRRL